MRIALIDTTRKARMYPLPLLKIGAWRKSVGDYCKIFYNDLPGAGEFDEIWITTTFTFDIEHAARIAKEATKRASRVLVGGVSATLMPKYFERVGAEVHRGLLPDAEKFSPDYSLLDETPKYSITHTSRGCVRKCGFCMVHRLEPDFHNRATWANDIHKESRRVLFYDNNWLAKDISDVERDVDILKSLVASGSIREIDFNQGLDARLMNERIADLITGIPIRPIRFAFDGMQEDGYYQNSVKMMADRGFSDFMAYVLYNFNDSPKDFYYRLRESVRLSGELGISANSFPMRYQPILEVDTGRDFVGKNWTSQKRNGFMAILNKQSVGGQVSMSDMREFEFWFGRDSDEFDRMLSYPKIRELMRRKKGALRLSRILGGSSPTATPTDS